jgi:hypothetical protein
MKVKAFYFVILLTAGIIGNSYAQSFHVRMDGDDNNNGLSADMPFKTLNKALEEASHSSIKNIIVIGNIFESYLLIDNLGDSEITISGESYTKAIISFDTSNAEFYSLSNGGLFFAYCSILIKGNSNIRFRNIEIIGDRQHSVMLIEDSSTVILDEGAKITDGVEVQWGAGGVRIFSGGKFIMSGGIIPGCSANQSGAGGVLVTGENAVFIMKSGIISDNYGGGVMVEYGGTFVMNGGEIIRNSALIVKWPSVYIEKGNFTKTGGIISGNFLVSYDDAAGILSGSDYDVPKFEMD